jgi:hypothetical protein
MRYQIALTATSSVDTSLSLKVEGKEKMTAGSSYSVSGKISMTTDGGSPKSTDTTNSKGEFEVDLNALESPGNYNIKTHFDGDLQYKSSDSSVKITVEETKVSSQKTKVTTNQPNTDEQQTDEQQTDEQQTEQQEPEEEAEEERLGFDIPSMKFFLFIMKRQNPSSNLCLYGKT